MHVPLTLSVYFGKQRDIQELVMWSNGKKHIVSSPINPYCYSNVRPLYSCEKSLVKRRLLSNPEKEIELWKCEFGLTGDISRYTTDDTSYENHIRFTNRLMMDEPDWLTKFANTDPLRILVFDIEVENDGKTFPKSEKNSILGIGYKCINGIENLGGDIDSDQIITIWTDDKVHDGNVIQDFMNVVKDFNPDILVGYNSNRFDLPYIRDRCKLNGINFDNYIARDVNVKEPIRFKENENLATKKKYMECRIEGRMSYDIYFPVMKDQSMFGIKDRTMKTVGTWFNIKDIIKEDMTNIDHLFDTDKDRLNRYLRSDINLTEQLLKIYLPNQIMLSERLLIPLDEIINGPPSLLGNVIFGRELIKKNIISDGPVIDRFDEKHVTNKRGGWVATYKTGFIKKIKKLDFKSYYPWLCVQFNLSPETVSIIGYENFKGELGYTFKIEDGYFYVSIPDSSFGKNVLIKINQKEEGFLPKYMKELFEERMILKKRMKEVDKDGVEFAGLKSRENAIKVILNSFTGYVGMSYSLYGNLGVYVAITGMGRYMTQKVIENFRSTVVSSDTDAIYEDGEIQEKDANNFISSIVTGEFGFKQSFITMESEGEDNFGSAYFLNTEGKNYYIFDKSKDKVIRHGVSTKSTSMAKILDKAQDSIVREMLTGGISWKNKRLIKLIDVVYDTSKWNILDIAKTTHLRHPKYYNKGTPIGLTIGRLAKKRYNLTDEQLEGRQEYYIKLRGKSNYGVVDIEKDKINDFQWDKDYYVKMIDNLLVNLGMMEFHPKNRGQIRTKQKTML